MKKILSVREWHQMTVEGIAPAMRITLNGYSMDPLIRFRKDYVTIVQLDTKPVVGDIVLFSDPNTEARYVVHRVWKTKGNTVMTWGDNCPGPDGWIPMDNVWGKVILIERGDRRIHPNPRLGLVWGWTWHQAMKAYRLRERIKGKIKKEVNDEGVETGETESGRSEKS